MSQKNPDSKIRVVRMERSLFDGLRQCNSSWRVKQIYRSGFDLLSEDNRLIYFHTGKLLHAPFGAIVHLPIDNWIKDICLREADEFYYEGHCFYRQGGQECCINFDSVSLVDLKRKSSVEFLSKDSLLHLIQGLASEIFKSGKFDGMAGAINLLENLSPGLLATPSFPISSWGRHSLCKLRKLSQHVNRGDVNNAFFDVWEELVGLGPGLTPAGDDFLVGFLAVHKFFSSSLGEFLKHERCKNKLRRKAESTTGIVAFQFLAFALEGIFSETLYAVFDELILEIYYKGQTLYTKGRGKERKQTEYFLTRGHSSGADTLTGTVFGLWTML